MGSGVARERTGGVHPAIAVGGNDLRLSVEMELISIMEGPAFKASARSREFLKFVVEETLEGRSDSLKERTIGSLVMGRDVSYDTGSDAGVRVRANDVRKRLASHYKQAPAKAGFRIELPTGSYVPRFEWEGQIEVQPKVRPASPPALSLWQLASPTVIALFLALVAIRFDTETSDAFTLFWRATIADAKEIFVEVDPAADGQSISPAIAEAALPLAAVGTSFQIPVHLGTVAPQPHSPRLCVIRLTTGRAPATSKQNWRIGGVRVFYCVDGESVLWLVGSTPEELKWGLQALAMHSSFPGFRIDSPAVKR